ncbi:3'-phosphatase, 5'-polynucleotide kinase [Shigella phage vB_SdyM_006]|nr:3'-phosphatase, 5'-polynucleotide kinase [Shigella phage vB_SdyM_006]
MFVPMQSDDITWVNIENEQVLKYMGYDIPKPKEEFVKQIIMTVGAPGSGKSTWAEEMVSANPGIVLNVNRDDLRCELFNCKRNEYKPSKQREREVTDKQQLLAVEWLNKSGHRIVIVSDTNLNPKTRDKWKDIAKTFKYQLDWVYFDEDLETLYKRNLYRGESAVPPAVIYSFYEKMQHYLHGVPDWSKTLDLPKAIIVDIDGTIADNNHRSPHDLYKLWKDTPRQNVINHINMMHDLGVEILLTSGREEGEEKEHRIGTEKWLNKHGVKYSKLIMRSHKDHRKDSIVKKELFYKHIANRYNVLYVLDDRQQVVDMWRVLGLECWQVNRGDF